MLQELVKWDTETFIYLNSLGIEKYDQFWSIVTQFTTWIPLFVLLIFLLFHKFSRQEAFKKLILLLGLVLFIIIITHLTKSQVARLRPNNDESINSLIRILKSPVDYSFFSGHAASSFAIVTLFFLLIRKQIGWALVLFIWPVLFSISRIYVGVHYPMDIFIGAAVGIISAVLFYMGYKRFS